MGGVVVWAGLIAECGAQHRQPGLDVAPGDALGIGGGKCPPDHVLQGGGALEHGVHGVAEVVHRSGGEPGGDCPELVAGQRGEQIPLGGEMAVEGGL